MELREVNDLGIMKVVELMFKSEKKDGIWKKDLSEVRGWMV